MCRIWNNFNSATFCSRSHVTLMQRRRSYNDELSMPNIRFSPSADCLWPGPPSSLLSEPGWVRDPAPVIRSLAPELSLGDRAGPGRVLTAYNQ